MASSIETTVDEFDPSKVGYKQWSSFLQHTFKVRLVRRFVCHVFFKWIIETKAYSLHEPWVRQYQSCFYLLHFGRKQSFSVSLCPLPHTQHLDHQSLFNFRAFDKYPVPDIGAYIHGFCSKDVDWDSNNVCNKVRMNLDRHVSICHFDYAPMLPFWVPQWLLLF